jgi:glycosyltransferase involved in cell wall biosynthesis
MLEVSVVIPSYNSARTIERCVRSVFASGGDAVEIVVVDDCSRDNSAAIVEALAAAWPGRLRLLRQPQNRGPAVARNRGAREARAPLIFFLDSDTEMLPDALPNFLARIRDADAVVGIYHHQPLNAGIVPLYKALLNYYFFSRLGVITYEVFDSSRAGIRRDVFEDVGGFNEKLRWGMDYENEELGYRLCERYSQILDPSVAVRHEFPGFRKMTATYFRRVALWAEIFFRRRRFESGGVTSIGTGLSSAGLLAAVLLVMLAALPLSAPLPLLLALGAAAAFGLYLWGYRGFFAFAAGMHPSKLPALIACNVFFTLVAATAATFGFLRAILGQSDASRGVRASQLADRS